MNWSELDLRPDDRKLRSFALFCGAALVVLDASIMKKAPPVVISAVLVGAAVIAAVGMIAPVTLRWLYVSLTVITFPIGWVMSRLVLLAMFLIIVTPLGLLLRIMGRDPLSLRRPDVERSEWRSRESQIDVISYLRQF